jgi:hypothetical protein
MTVKPIECLMPFTQLDSWNDFMDTITQYDRRDRFLEEIAERASSHGPTSLLTDRAKHAESLPLSECSNVGRIFVQ